MFWLCCWHFIAVEIENVSVLLLSIKDIPYLGYAKVNICSIYRCVLCSGGNKHLLTLFSYLVGRKDVVKEHLCESDLYTSIVCFRWGYFIDEVMWLLFAVGGLLFELAALFFLLFPLFGFRKPMIGFHFCLHLMKRKRFLFKSQIENWKKWNVCVYYRFVFICLSEAFVKPSAIGTSVMNLIKIRKEM